MHDEEHETTRMSITNQEEKGHPMASASLIKEAGGWSPQPQQLRPVQTTASSTDGMASAHTQLMWDMIFKDHLFDYLVTTIDNESEQAISTECIANEHQPSKVMLCSLNLAWFI